MRGYYPSNHFINRKLDNLIYKAENKYFGKEADFVDRLDTGTFEGFTVSRSKDSKILTNENGNTIEVPFPESGGSSSMYIYITMQSVTSGYYVEKKNLPFVVTVAAQNFTSLEKDFLKHLNDLERKKKILELTKNSAISWLKNMLKDSGYTYFIEETPIRVVLSIIMKNKTQLNMPIHYKNFQKIMPTLMDLIKGYEKLIDSSDIKVTITNLKQK
ncbi:MAG: hypothetical protein LBG47_10190 [Prevotellaceae bacterium]|jgi:hypothetical protein|nr:hypothetical protein [Prevotellaceae bacterium]